jgi:ribose 5-phosphate isomerase B
MSVTIAIGSDHAGFDQKKILVSFLEEKGYTVHDFGTYSTDSVDYPDIAHQVADSKIFFS